MATQVQPENTTTPLQMVLGFECAEEIYDMLEIREQIILDLLIAGMTQEEIGDVLDLSQGWVSVIIHRVRYKLATSKLRTILEMRIEIREGRR
jgi:DNA-binding NarL/FixJ family response regulator